ncbi:MAG: sigma factor-like helix-turn-helix DNA-binding protein [Acidimicrobiales bacterium]
MAGELSDADIAGTIAGTIAGRREEALADAYERHGASVYAMVSRLCPVAQAEQVTRKVFLALWHAPEDFPPEGGSLRVPLMAAAHARAVQLLRADGERRALEATMTAEDLEQRVIGPWPPEGALRLLSQLPPAERKAIVLAYFGGYTYEEVASRTDQVGEAVKRDIGVGLRRLRASI